MTSSSSDSAKQQILVIDNNPRDLKLLSAMLTQQGYRVSSTTDEAEALSIVETGLTQLILLALNLPEMSGYEICQLLKAKETTQQIPIIFLSASDDPLDQVKAFQIGCSDYISKQLPPEIVLVRIASQIKSHQLKERLAQKVQKYQRELAVTNQKLQQEINQRKQAQDRLLKLALHDSITGLPNRKSYLSTLKQALQKIKQKSDYQFAIFLIECERFQEIKCYLGHLATNQLFIEIARRLRSLVSDQDFLASFENNQFAIILNNFQDQQAIIDYTKRIQEQFTKPFNVFSPIPEIEIVQQEMSLSCSLGIVLGNKNYKSEHNLLQDAEIAVYQATQSKEQNYHLLQSSIASESYTLEQRSLQSESKKILKEALTKKQFLVYYQPIFTLLENKIIGFEALLRWQNNEGKIILPREFLPIVNNTELSINLCDLVIQQACSQLKTLHQQHESQKDFFITINLSKQQLLQPKLKSKIRIILQKYKLLSHYLSFDIPASILLNNRESIKELLKELKMVGIKISVDDFSSHAESIKELPYLLLNNIKIDASLIKQIESKSQSHITIQKIIEVAHKLKMTVIAEGIETETQLNYLKSWGCDYGQGFLFSEPLASDSLETFLLWRM